jgi:hypothetical protein
VYGLLLAAYPRTFRRAYGEPMAQLFRDTALAAYRRRGLLGLAAHWWATAGDWAASALRQHWEEALRWSGPEATAAGGEGVSARNVVRGWVLLVWSALATAWLSARFALQLGRHLVLRRALATGAVLLALALGTTVWSYFGHGRFGNHYWDLKLQNGAVIVRHIYARDEPVTVERWRTDPAYRTSWASPTPWDFHFSADHYIGSGAWLGRVTPERFWLLRFPLWLPPALLLCWGALRLFRDNARSGGTMSCGDLTSS